MGCCQVKVTDNKYEVFFIYLYFLIDFLFIKGEF